MIGRNRSVLCKTKRLQKHINRLTLLVAMAMGLDGFYVCAQVRGQFIVKEGDEAPSFSYVAMDGDTLDTDFMRGRVTLLQFAASWCPFSQAQLLDIQEFIYDKYSSSAEFDIMVFCVDTTENAQSKLKEIIETDGVKLPYSYDRDNHIYNLFSTPKGNVTRSVIIDREWRIVELHDLHTWRNLKQMKRTVKRLLRKED